MISNAPLSRTPQSSTRKSRNRVFENVYARTDRRRPRLRHSTRRLTDAAHSSLSTSDRSPGASRHSTACLRSGDKRPTHARRKESLFFVVSSRDVDCIAHRATREVSLSEPSDGLTSTGRRRPGDARKRRETWDSPRVNRGFGSTRTPRVRVSAMWRA